VVNNQKGVVLTLGHLRLALLVLWMIGGLPTITWLALVQFFSVTYLQVFLPYVLLYGLLVSIELVRGYIAKGA
jgi:hypothetical protein